MKCIHLILLALTLASFVPAFAADDDGSKNYDVLFRDAQHKVTEIGKQIEDTRDSLNKIDVDKMSKDKALLSRYTELSARLDTLTSQSISAKAKLEECRTKLEVSKQEQLDRGAAVREDAKKRAAAVKKDEERIAREYAKIDHQKKTAAAASYSSAFSLQNFDKIQIGMSYTTVLQALGPPTSFTDSGSRQKKHVTYTWGTPSAPPYAKVECENGVVKSKSWHGM